MGRAAVRCVSNPSASTPPAAPRPDRRDGFSPIIHDCDAYGSDRGVSGATETRRTRARRGVAETRERFRAGVVLDAFAREKRPRRAPSWSPR